MTFTPEANPIVYADVEAIFVGGPLSGQRITVPAGRHYHVIRAKKDGPEVFYRRIVVGGAVLGRDPRELHEFFVLPATSLNAITSLYHENQKQDGSPSAPSGPAQAIADASPSP